jgi:uncharacterized protein (TIGR01777 family)
MLPNQDETYKQSWHATRAAGMDAGCMDPTSLSGHRILLSGASGLLGTALRTSLLGSGAEILQLVRRPPAGPRELEWNPAAQRPVASGAVEGLTAVIHLSGANVAAQRWTPIYRREMWSSRVKTTGVLAEVFAGFPQPPPVLLVASAVGIYGDRGDEVLDESSQPGTGFLAELCREWEEAAEPASRAGIRVVHLRFGVVLARGGALAKMLPVFRLGLGGKLGSGSQWMSWIALDDVVSAVRFLLASDLSGPFNLCAPNPVTNADFTRTLAAALHRPALFSVPAFALRAAVGHMADEALLASARVHPTRLTQAGFKFAYPELSPALAAILG